LADQLSRTRETGLLSRKSLPSITTDDDDDHKATVNETLLGPKETERILAVSRAQITENEEQQDPAVEQKRTAIRVRAETPTKSKSLKTLKKEEVFQIASSNISLHDILGDADEDLQSTTGSMCAPPKIELTEGEEKALEMFMPQSSRQQVTLQEVIMKRVAQREEDNLSLLSPDKIIRRRIPKRIVGVYAESGRIAQKWRSGKLPKALKILPQLQDWEELLYVANPDRWTPNVMYQVTKHFVSQSGNAVCQRFFNVVLLPMVREEIEDNKKLSFHLFQALRKSLFKPQAFFRGLLLPLCEDEFRAREAVVIGAVLAKGSVPVIHSALAIFKLLELPFSGPVHYVLRVLLNKRYAMPMKVLAALVSHFKKFEGDERKMTVIWHQTFLVFAERYKKALSREQRESLKLVLKRQYHPKITPLVRKELFANVEDKITAMDIDI